MTKAKPKPVNENGTKTRTYQAPDGTELEFRAISQWALGNFEMAWERKKPLPPMVKTEIGDDENPNDSRYKHDLMLWGADKGIAAAHLIMRVGIVTPVPSDYMKATQSLYPDMLPDDVKVEWIYELLGSAEEVGKLTELIVGVTQATEAGIAEASKSFRGENKR